MFFVHIIVRVNLYKIRKVQALISSGFERPARAQLTPCVEQALGRLSVWFQALGTARIGAHPLPLGHFGKLIPVSVADFRPFS